MFEDKFEFENPRHNPQILAAPDLKLTEQNLFLTELQCSVPFKRILLHLNNFTCLGVSK